MDHKERIGKVIEQMIADGASHEDIMAFVPQAQAKLHAEKYQQTLEKTRLLKADADQATSLGAYVGAGAEGLWDRLKGMGQGVAEIATHPIETFKNPARRRELERGIDDAVTLGYGQKLSNYLTGKFGGQSMAETEQADAQAAPNVRVGGNVLGAFLPGATRGIGRGAGAVASKVAPTAGALGSVARGGLTYELAAPAIAGLHAGAEGDRAGAAFDAATDPGNLLLATGTGAVIGGVAKKVNQSRGAEARRFIEARGGGARVGVTTPGKGGVFADELARVPANDKGIGQAARIAAEKITEGIKEQHRVETSRPYKAMKAKIDNSPAATELCDVTPIVTNMEDAVFDLETSSMARAQLKEQLSILERYRKNAGDPDSPILVPERQLNGLRRTLMRAAKIGATDSPGEKEAPLRSAAFAAKQLVDEGPYARLNELYNQGADKLTKARRSLGLKAKAGPDSNVDTKKVKLSLEREGQNTKTGGGDSDLAGFRAAHPELARQADLTELARARADLAFHLMPQHGGLIERTAGASLGPGAAIGAAAIGQGPAGILGAAGILGLQNATPIAGRMLYPLTRNATGATAANPILTAYQAERERNRRRAAAARGQR